jgi:hypothetical protein
MVAKYVTEFTVQSTKSLGDLAPPRRTEARVSEDLPRFGAKPLVIQAFIE